MKPAHLILLCLATGLYGTLAAAVTAPAVSGVDSSRYIYRMEEIIIYGPRAVGGTSMITEVEDADIQRKSAVTVADVLRFDPGLSVSQGPKAETETKIRAFPARDVLVLVDGRPINPGYYGKVDLAMLPVENIAKIKLIKGPASVAYGPNSMGGVINIVTKNGLEKPRTVLSGEFGDYQFRKLSVNHSRAVGRMNYWISAYEGHSGGYKLSEDFQSTSIEDGGLRDNSSYRNTGVSGKLGYQPEDNNLYSLSLGYHWAEKSIPPTIYSWESPEYREFPGWERINSSLSGNWHLSQTFELKSQVFVDGYHDRLISYSGPEMTDDQVVWNSKLENWTVGGSADGKIGLTGNHRLHTGLSLKRDLMNKKPDLDDPWFSHYILTGSAFAQDNFFLTERTEVTAGLSYSQFGTESDNLSTSRLCPMVSVRQDLPARLLLRGAYSKAIRFPTLHQLYSEGSGNEDLNAERANKYEIGLERAFSLGKPGRTVSLETVFFHNDLKDLIYRASRSYRFENIDEATLRGIEIRSAFAVSSYFSGEIGYARIDPTESSKEIREEVPVNKVRVLLTARTRFGLEAQYELNVFDERTTHVADRVLDPYEIHNIGLAQSIGSHVKLHLKVRNAGDVDYQEELGYPQPGRQVFGGFTFTI